jgi:hypothetical protein
VILFIELIASGELQGESSEWVTVTFSKTKGAAVGDFIAVFSPAKFEYVSEMNLPSFLLLI